MKRIIHAIKGKFFRNASILAGGTTISQAIIILSTPILTRIFSPEEFGVYSIYIAILAILVTVGSLLYELAIPLPEKDEEAINIVVLCFLIITFFSIIYTVIFTFLSDQIASLLNVPSISSMLFLIPIAFFGGAIFQTLHYWSVRKEVYKNISITKINQSASQVISQISFGLLQFGRFGLLLGDAIGRMIAGFSMLFLTLRHERKLLKVITWTKIKEVAARYRRFPILSSGSSLINSVSLQLPAFFLTALYGPVVVGMYVLAQRILGIPVTIIGGAVAQVYLGEASKIDKLNHIGYKKLFWKTIKSMSFIAAVFLPTFFFFAPPLFSIVFGPEWKEAGVYLQLLCLMYFFQFISAPIGYNIVVFERQDLEIYREISRIVILLIAFLIVFLVNVSGYYAILLLSISGTIGYIIHSLLSWYAMESHFKHNEKGGE